jgi:hypothetical protein
MVIVRSGHLVRLVRPCGFGVGLGLPRAQSLCIVGVSREPSPFGVNIGRIDVFRDWLLRLVVSGRSGCSMSIGFVIRVVGLVIVGQGVVQGRVTVAPDGVRCEPRSSGCLAVKKKGLVG